MVVDGGHQDCEGLGMDLGYSGILGHMKDPDKHKDNLSSNGSDMQETDEICLNLRENLRQISRENS